jgi:hypothetical protein
MGKWTSVTAFLLICICLHICKCLCVHMNLYSYKPLRVYMYLSLCTHFWFSLDKAMELKSMLTWGSLVLFRGLFFILSTFPTLSIVPCFEHSLLNVMWTVYVIPLIRKLELSSVIHIECYWVHVFDTYKVGCFQVTVPVFHRFQYSLQACDEGEHALGMPGKGRVWEVKSLLTVKGVDW